MPSHGSPMPNTGKKPQRLSNPCRLKSPYEGMVQHHCSCLAGPKRLRRRKNQKKKKGYRTPAISGPHIIIHVVFVLGVPNTWHGDKIANGYLTIAI